MKTIFNTMFIFFACWLTLNWIADNPLKIEAVRTSVNHALSEGYKAASATAKKNLNETRE
tara:strand:- start:1938 stop:2117 length:180 start_codon:yes stop_codon:yes gene_type:complete